MPARSMKRDDPLEDFAPREIAFDGVARRVYVAGRGPAVIVMSEMPGISPEVARFARWVRDAGFAVYMPSLFGRDGAVPRTEEGVAVFRMGDLDFARERLAVDGFLKERHRVF